jgi:septal ring factor EnvC (AmiA/AmiB activator)
MKGLMNMGMIINSAEDKALTLIESNYVSIDDFNSTIENIKATQNDDNKKIDVRIHKVEDNQIYMKKNIHNNYKDIKRISRKIKNIQVSISATSSNIKTLDTNLSSLRNREQRDYNMCLDNHLELGVLKTKTKINRIMDIILITMMTINVILDFIIILGGMY